jgi:hypothetical protein
VVTATLPVIPTATPTATATGEAYKINFWADRETITAGECTVLRWETDNIQAVYYEGKGVVGNGSSEECPDSDTTYGLKVILRDGSTQTRTVKIKVKEPVATKVPPTNTSVPPSETPVPPTSEPTTSVPPTTEPTTETPPTTP